MSVPPRAWLLLIAGAAVMAPPTHTPAASAIGAAAEARPLPEPPGAAANATDIPPASGAPDASGIGAAANDPPEPGLRVSLGLSGLEGGVIERAPVGDAFRLRIRFTNPSGTPATGLEPAAWLRRPGPGRPVCQEAARAFRVTGRISSDDVRLAGLFVLTLDAEGRLAVVDPNRPVSSGAMVAISPLGEVPGSLLVHMELGAAVASRPAHGDVVRLFLPSGKPTVIATGLGRPGALATAAGGRIWVADDAGGRALLLGSDGHIAAAETLPEPGPVRLVEAGSDRVLAVGTGGAARMLDRATGHLIARFPAESAPGAVAATRDMLVAADGDGILVRRWSDNPDQPERLDVPGRVGTIVTGPDGHWLVAGTDDPASGPGIHIIDLTRGRRVHGFAAPEPPDEAVVAGDAAFLTWKSRPVVTVVDIAALTRGGAQNGDAAVRDVRLLEGTTGDPPLRTGPMMVPLEPLPAVAVVRPGARALATVMAGGGLSSAPMSIVPLKGDPPRQLAAFARSLVEVAPGTFEVSAQLPRGGAWELVTTTGIGGTTACLPVASEPEPTTPAVPRLTATLSEGTAAEGRDLLVRIDPPPAAASLRLLVAALSGGWARVIEARAGADNTYRARVVWPGEDSFSIALADPRHGIAPVVLRVTQ